jgi:xanthine/CO dehydrogenase XdhC/CoxF family maturation factor
VKEISAILRAWACYPEKALALATLVEATGSTYRRPGARMLLLDNGLRVGSVSAGCLERDVIEKAAEVVRSKKSVLLTYDTSAESDIVFGTGLGCEGAVHILLEPLAAGMPAARFLDVLEKSFARGESTAAVTVVRAPGNSVAVGRRFMLDAQGNTAISLGDPASDACVQPAAGEALAGNRSTILTFELAGGRIQAWVEALSAPWPIFIIGAGYDVEPLRSIAQEIGFHVTVADPRGQRDEPKSRRVRPLLPVPPENASQLRLDLRTAAVIMSHNYLTDYAFLKALLPLKLRYLGLMGPRARAEKMLEEMRREGFAVLPEWLQRLYNPIGLDIGAENPEQIALAILAEIQAVITGRPGRSLREKKGPIHEHPG